MGISKCVCDQIYLSAVSNPGGLCQLLVFPVFKSRPQILSPSRTVVRSPAVRAGQHGVLPGGATVDSIELGALSRCVPEMTNKLELLSTDGLTGLALSCCLAVLLSCYFSALLSCCLAGCLTG